MSGNFADINKKKEQLWVDILARVNFEHGNARSFDEIRKKWTNLKLAAKSKVDSSSGKLERLEEAQTKQELLRMKK